MASGFDLEEIRRRKEVPRGERAGRRGEEVGKGSKRRRSCGELMDLRVVITFVL